MRSVLITGGTGYFGKGLVRHLMRTDTQRICIYSRDEAKQAAMRASIPDPDKRLHFFVGDVRDGARLKRAMNGVGYVIHAAALKRVEVGEYDPAEMVKTNVLGTMNVIDAAMDAPTGMLDPGPRRVVALSTDKACQPLNAYGASKLMLEKLILGANNARGRYGPTFAVTRYGNVAGSTGSVIPNWRRAVAGQTKDVMLTDPLATRFWMTLQQAIDLVLNTARCMVGGELVIPDLPAYQLGDLIQAMGINPLDVNWHITGLGPGEKLHERMKENGPDSSQTRRMTVDELREALKSV